MVVTLDCVGVRHGSVGDASPTVDLSLTSTFFRDNAAQVVEFLNKLEGFSINDSGVGWGLREVTHSL